MRTSSDKTNHAITNAQAWLDTINEMLADESREADERILEAPLSVLVRDGWRTPGAASEGALEYEILLSTGGPALRIYGELDRFDNPETAELQWQDLGTPWIRYPAAEETLLRFARCFYFGS